LFKKLKRRRRVVRSDRMNGGRAYFEEQARRLDESGSEPELQRGPAHSRLGGYIARDLRRPTPEETAEARENSEEYLEREPVRFPEEH